MRIAIGTNSIERPGKQDNYDGIGVYTHEVIKYLSYREEVSVLQAYFPTVQQWKPPENKMKRFVLPYPLLATVSELSNFNSWMLPSIVDNIDLFHATDYRIPKLKKIPVVATLHDAVQLKNRAWVRDWARDYKNWILRAAGKRADRVIAISEATVPDLVEYFGIERDKIRVVHNGISTEWLNHLAKKERERILIKYGIDKKYILFVGTFQPRKNLARILLAFENLPVGLRKEFKLILIGQAGWKVDKEIAQIKRMAARNECLWLGNVPHVDMPALYQAASMFLFPSLYEGFGIPVLEAFASGVPVLTSNVSALPEVAGNAALLVDPWETEEISSGIVNILEDDELRSRLIERGRIRAQEMSWSSCAEKTIEVYKELL